MLLLNRLKKWTHPCYIFPIAFVALDLAPQYWVDQYNLFTTDTHSVIIGYFHTFLLSK